jgi:low temperature requirement protein LtrA
LRGHGAQRASGRALIWHAAAAVPWLTGALVSGTARTGLWAAAVVLLYAVRWFSYPLPGRTRLAGTELPPGGEYLAERHQALFVIGLGEAVLAIGTTITSHGFNAVRTVAFAVAFLLTALIWRIYIFRAGEETAPAIEASAMPGRLSNLLSYAHLIMIAGLVVTSAADDLVIDHPFGHPRPAAIATILGGPALFLAGRTLLQYLVFSRIWSGRLIGLAALACLAPPMLLVPPLVTAMATGTVLTGTIIYDAMLERRQHLQVSPPGPHRPSDK